MHRTALGTVFGVAGGFAIAELFSPANFGTRCSTGSKNRSDIELKNVPFFNTITIGSPALNQMHQKEGPVTLCGDIAKIMERYGWYSAIAVFIVISGGGLPALIGAGASVYCSGKEGAARYVQARQWLAKNGIHIG